MPTLAGARPAENRRAQIGASHAGGRRRQRGGQTLCPRCNQWRFGWQFDRVLQVCEPCAGRIVTLSERRQAPSNRRTPSPKPQRDPSPYAEVNKKRQALIEDLLFLLEVGENEAAITRRLGFASPASLHTKLYRAGRPDLVAALGATREAVA